MSAAQPSASPTARADLALEAAVAARIIRSARVPCDLLLWLSRAAGVPRAAGTHCGPSDGVEQPCDTQLTALLDEIVKPLNARPSNSQRPLPDDAAQWLAVACRCAGQQSSRLQLSIGPRLLVASLLPLYRCLATDDLHEGLRQTQLRLSETLCLLALCEEGGPAMAELLDTVTNRLQSPHGLLAKHFNLSLQQIARLLNEASSGFDFSNDRFSPAASQRLQAFNSRQSQLDTPAWAAPELLWNLAGELTSERSELKLPRSWTDISLPWNNIVAHLHNLLELLRRQSQPFKISGHAPSGHTAQASTLADDLTRAGKQAGSAAENTAGKIAVKAAENAPVDTPADAEQIDFSDEHSTLAAIHEISALIPGNQPAAGHQAVLGVRPIPAARPGEDCSPIAPPPLSQPSPAAAMNSSSAIPKVLISDISTHEDPSFVTAIRRQINKCRSENRALSLIAVIVLPEDASHHFAVYDNGLNLWQQKLVGWLSQHPQVVEPHAFLTAGGELLLSLLDLERNETTELLRHGLVEVLTGQRFDSSQGNLLAEVDAPARYHAGIASTSSPGVRFLPEQLIDPAIRCLSAARLHGKASIKSIEVY